MIVADNTLISYYTIAGEYTEEAVAVRKKDAEWATVPLWRYEFLNTLWLYVRQDQLDLATATEHLEVAETLTTNRVMEAQQRLVLRLAAESGCTGYDCQYVALAEVMNVPLITHDREVLAAFPKRARHPDDFLG